MSHVAFPVILFDVPRGLAAGNTALASRFQTVQSTLATNVTKPLLDRCMVTHRRDFFNSSSDWIQVDKS